MNSRREQRTTCAACPIHCYNKEMQQQVRRVMSYAGPRMLWHHPLLALLHLVDRMKGSPNE